MIRNNKNTAILASFVMALLSGCTTDVQPGNYDRKVSVVAEDFSLAPQTRTAYEDAGSGTYKFSWSEGDALGIFPESGRQTEFPISNGYGTNTALFDGGKWALRPNESYAAYYPFVERLDFPKTAIPISYLGQTQNDNGSTAHLGAYDYMASSYTEVDAKGNVNFNLQHLGCLVQFKLKIPKDAMLTNANISSEGTEFVTTGTFDISVVTPSITPNTNATNFDISLSNIPCAENDVFTLYTMLAPVDMSGEKLTITLTDNKGATYIYECQGCNFTASRSYSFTLTETGDGSWPSGHYTGWEYASDGHYYVDLGLSVKWATCNVGAIKPEDFGNYYAWGETVPQADNRYDWFSYTWCNDSYYAMTKYCTSSTYGTIDNKTQLDLEDDAANANWGGTWRMPTYTELDELCKGCYWLWTANYNGSGIKGYIIYMAKANADKGKIKNTTNNVTLVGTYSLSDTHIFLPAAGGRWEALLHNDNSCGYYWASTLRTSNNNLAQSIKITSTDRVWNDDRCRGFSVRAVCP